MSNRSPGGGPDDVLPRMNASGGSVETRVDTSGEARRGGDSCDYVTCYNWNRREANGERECPEENPMGPRMTAGRRVTKSEGGRGCRGRQMAKLSTP